MMSVMCFEIAVSIGFLFIAFMLVALCVVLGIAIYDMMKGD